MQRRVLVSSGRGLSETRRASTAQALAAVSLVLAAASCDFTLHADVAASHQGVVYGKDDRKEPLTPDEPAWLAEATRTRLLALGPLAQVSRSPAGELTVDAQSLRQRYNLCDGQAFAEQPSFAHCSGVLMSSRYVLTAEHCTRAAPLAEQGAIRGFHYELSADLARLDAGDLFTFDHIVAEDDYWDYAWLELAEPAAELVALPLGAVSNGDAVLSVQHGAGLPAKLLRSTASSVDDAAFLSTLDAFGGASGAPVFSESGALLGMLTSGAPDYIVTASGCSKAVHRVDAVEFAAELALRIDVALEGLCASVADPELCPPVPAVAHHSDCSIRGARGASPNAALLVMASLVLVLGAVVRRRSRHGAAST